MHGASKLCLANEQICVGYGLTANALLLTAPVTAQRTLAEGIGGNQGYQQYLISVEQVAANKEVGIRMAEALAKADLHVIANGGGAVGDGNIMEGARGLLKMLNPHVGTQMAGMAPAMGATPEGQKLLDSISGSKMTAMVTGAAVGAATGTATAAAASAVMA